MSKWPWLEEPVGKADRTWALGVWAIALIWLALGSLASAAEAACPNEAFRVGPSSTLPDCRAYELVTPPRANGRLFTDLRGELAYDRFRTELLAPAGDSMVYGTYGSPLQDLFGVNGVFDLYVAERSSSGWRAVRRLSPSGQEGIVPNAGGVSQDHRYTFTIVPPLSPFSGGSLAEDGIADYLGHPDGSFELTGVGSLGTEPLAQGRYLSPTASHVIFSTGATLGGSLICLAALNCPVHRLEPNAPPEGTGAVYDRSPDGPTRVVSLLPGDIPPAAGEDAEYQGASEDGSVLAFKIAGTLYVRVNNVETLEATSAPASFAGLSETGRYLVYVSNGNVFRFDIAAKTTEQINSSGDAKVAYVSNDGSHVYFISSSQLDGLEGTTGEPNMYVWDEEGLDYIATVSSADLSALPGLGNWVEWVVNPERSSPRGPGASAMRATPDGHVIAFESRAQLTSFVNDGRVEIYRYDDRDQSLQCASCNPAGTPAMSGARFQALKAAGPAIEIHNLSDDGTRIFFETEEALVAEDVDGDVNDIYEWHKQIGGSLEELDLISSGQSVLYPSPQSEFGFQPQPNRLLGINPSGQDVVFSSLDQLLPSAGSGGVPAIYDARVGGGFPQPPPAETCSQESCRSSADSFPLLQAPSSGRITANGNVKPRKRRCRRDRSEAVHQRAKRRCHKHRHRRGRHRGSVAQRLSSVIDGENTIAKPTADPPSAGDGGSVNPAASASAASTVFSSFGIKSVNAELSTTAAAAHPDFRSELKLNFETVGGKPKANARVQDISVHLPPGLVGEPNAVSRCSTGLFIAVANCPTDSQVGVVKILASGFGETTEPVYNLQLPHPDQEVARLGFFAFLYPTYIDIHVRTDGDYGVTATVHGASGLAPLLSAETTLWGNPGDPSHDDQRLTAAEAINCKAGTACEAPDGKRSIPPTPAFMTNPSACQQGEVGFDVTSYQIPGKTFSAVAPLPSITACQDLPFEPTLEVQPTNQIAGAPTGLHAAVHLPQNQGPEERATATMRNARVTLPEGMTISASAAQGLEGCSSEQVGFHREVPAQCPDASKLGTVKIVSPALSEPLDGEIYQRTPSSGHQFGLWLVTDELGLHVKLPGEVIGDPQTGRLTAQFQDLPQVPVEEVALDFWGGPRAPLKNPDSCGVHQTSFEFKPWSDDPPVSGSTGITIDQRCAGGFAPKLKAGVTRPMAGKFSPLIVQLTREDGEDNIAGLDVLLPKGLLAKLKGVPLCAEAAAPTAACSTESQIGSVVVAAGAGPQPLWLPQPGKEPTGVYLAGPYAGAPYSIVTKVPAQAGPFDLGTVVVRSGIYIDSESGQVTVRTTLPQVLEGATVLYRTIHVMINRPSFALNPTSCEAMTVGSTVTSLHGLVAHPADRFQVDGCRALGFRPELSLKLRGGTARGDFPALTAILKTRKRDANIGSASVALPHSEFLAQEHIGTICTRTRFAAHNCPKRSIYGYAKAWTPLLDEPLKGPVYLRSSGEERELPDLVAALRGRIEIDLVGYIDSVHGGIRTTFASVPDAPITKFVLKMKGGEKGLLENSEDICRRERRATVSIDAQNGRRNTLRPRLFVSCGQR